MSTRGLAEPAATHTNSVVFRRGLEQFLTRMRANANVFHAVTEGLALGLNWRWAAVTRFTDAPGWVRMLAWWSDGHFSTPFDYALRHHPCEEVARVGGYCYFDDVPAQFPHDDFSRTQPIRVYAGQVYFGPDGSPLGHLIAAHESTDVHPAEARALFDVLGIVMGLELRYRGAAEVLAEAERAAKTDPLTGLGNRRAFDTELAQLALDRPLATMLAIIDLDGLKAVNDRRGHACGDALLMGYAAALRRHAGPHDSLFRLGGDEFAVIAQGSQPRLERLLADALADVRTELHSLGQIGASHGIVEPRAYGWNLATANAEADRRMYAAKNASRAA
jgi:diguanylate cyclase (GGDEF)-like protein